MIVQHRQQPNRRSTIRPAHRGWRVATFMVCALFVMGTFAPHASAQQANELTPAIDDATSQGLRFLITQQSPDGSFGGGRFGPNVAVTSLACLAFMADGHLPGRGEYGDAVLRGLEYILNNSTENGLIAAEPANGPMYGHGFATLFLGEVYGAMADDPELDDRVYEALDRAVRLIERTQNEEGGWRYNPVPFDADVSVTICQVMGLRSARNAGLEVDKQVIDRAVQYIRQCQNADGGFRYQRDGGQSGWPRSAAGVASLYYAGIYEDQALERGLEYLRVNARPGAESSRAHLWYGHYYSVQAMFLAGGQHWADWWPTMAGNVLDLQERNGSWDDRSVGPSYGTAVALIILQMPKRYLPIFQR